MRATNYIQSRIQSSKPPSYRYLTDNTITGQQLSTDEALEITQKLNLGPNDQIEFIYSNDGHYSVFRNVLIGVTKTCLFKIDNYAVSRVLRSNLIGVKFLKSDVYNCDKLQCDLITGESTTLTIFHRQACLYFCEYLQKCIDGKSINTTTNSASAIPISIAISEPESPISPTTPYLPQNYSRQPEVVTSTRSSPIPIPMLKRQTNSYVVGRLSSSVDSQSPSLGRDLSSSFGTQCSATGSPVIIRSVHQRSAKSAQYSPPLSPSHTVPMCPPNSPHGLLAVGSPYIQFKVPEHTLSKNLSPPTFFLQDYNQHAYPSHSKLKVMTEKRQMGFGTE
jgi:hypothetical protein